MKKIVIIDDSNPFVMLVKHLLEDENVLVDSFEDAVDFLRIPSRITAYDLIILDINLPGMNGLQVLEELKSKPATRDVPVLLLSGDSRSEIVVKGIRRGAIDFLTKPVDPPQLLERVMKHLQPEGKAGSMSVNPHTDPTDSESVPAEPLTEAEQLEVDVMLSGDHQTDDVSQEEPYSQALGNMPDDSSSASEQEHPSQQEEDNEADTNRSQDAPSDDEKNAKASVSDAADS